MKKFLSLLVFSGFFFLSCNSDDPIPTPIGPQQPEPINYTSGSADLSNYVSVGNSLTAGFSDGALFAAGQIASLPNMMATSFEAAGGGSFSQPLMADDLGGATLGGTPILGNRLFLSFASGSPTPTPVEGMGATEISSTLSGPFNNMGVPGAKSYHLLAPGYGNVQGVAAGLANPYFARFASDPMTTVLGDAAGQNPSFFSLWIGNNDILSFATSGGDGVDQTGSMLTPDQYGGNDITDPMVFAGIYNGILQTLTAQGAKGVVANLPDVTTIPYFTTVPHNPIPLDAATAELVNSSYTAYNEGLLLFQSLGAITADEVAKRTISFSESAGNAAVIIDENLTFLSSPLPDGSTVTLPSIRQATADDLIVLPARTFIGTLADPNNPTSINGVAVPLADKWVLTPEEQQAVKDATVAYNQTIETLANQYELAFVDANAYLNTVAVSGAPLSDGSVVTATYATGGGFSLDGVHPSPRGYALLANQFIAAIEAKYGATLPKVNPLEFTGVYIQ